MSSERRKPKKQEPNYRNCYSKDVNIDLIESLAFRSLTSAAKSLCIRCFIENGYAAHKKRKNGQGHPHFKWSAGDSEKIGISGRNHFKAIQLLKDRGFISIDKQGGLLGVNGTANYFVLLSDWKRKRPPSKEVSPALLSKLAIGRTTALQNRSKKHSIGPIIPAVIELKPVNSSSLVQTPPTATRRKIPLNISSLVESRSDTPLQPGQAIYYKRPEDRRALKAELVKQTGDSWEVRGARTSTNIKRPIFIVSKQYLLPVDQVKNAK